MARLIRGCVLKHSTDQTAQDYDTAPAVVPFNGNVFDTEGFQTGTDGTITIPSWLDGSYGIFTGTLSLANVTGDDAHWMQSVLLKNGTAGFIGCGGRSGIQASGNGQLGTSFWGSFNSPVNLLTSGDTFKLQLWNNNDNDTTVKAESTFGLYVIDNASITQRVLATLSADLTARNFTTPAVIPFNTDTYDTDAVHDTVTGNSKLIVPAAWDGLWGVVYAAVVITSGTNNTTSSLAIRKNGTSLTYNGFGGNSGHCGPVSTFCWQVQTQILQFATGDYYEALMYSSSDSSVTVVAGGTYLGAWVYGEAM